MLYSNLTKRGRGRRTLAWILIILGVVLTMWPVVKDADLATGLPPMVFGLFLIGIGINQMMRGRKIGQKTADELQAEDQRPPVVFLRAFYTEPKGIDDIFGFTKRYQLLPDVFGEYQGSRGQTLFASHMNKIGPFIALGRPGEKFPGEGAGRKYVSDEEWKPTVKKWISKAALVVIWTRHPGDSSGFSWEMEQLIKLTGPTRILLILPSRLTEYKKFKNWADQILPRPLPDKRPASWLMTFYSNWEPQPLSLKKVHKGLFAVLSPMLQQNGIPLPEITTG